MSTSEERPGDLGETLTAALGRLLAHLGVDDTPQDLNEQIRAFQRVKGDRGRKAVAASLGLHEAELPFVDAALRDVERAQSTQDDADEAVRRNRLLAQMRLLSWLETIGQRKPELALDPEVETAVSEDLGRKQVRAVELVVRSLITESYGEQEALIARHVRCYDRHKDIEDPDHPKALIEQRHNAREQKLFGRFLMLSPKAEDYYRALAERRLNPRHHVQKIVALSEIHGAEAVARAMEDAFAFQAFSCEYIANLLESRQRLLPEPGALQLTRHEDLLDLEMPEPDLAIYEPTSTTREDTP